jgi:peptide/nickel transport system substrate-binding protein
MRQILTASLAGLLAAGAATAALAQEPRRGGVINVATIGEPPTLDPSVSTTDVVGMISLHYFETLYTFGTDWKIVPLLAAGDAQISDGGKVYTIPLRTGVKFHDGSIMTSADVVASLKRWMDVAVRGKQAAAFITDVAAPDPNTVRITLKEPYAPQPPVPAHQRRHRRAGVEGAGTAGRDRRHRALPVPRAPARPLRAADPVRRLRRP